MLEIGSRLVGVYVDEVSGREFVDIKVYMVFYQIVICCRVIIFMFVVYMQVVLFLGFGGVSRFLWYI